MQKDIIRTYRRLGNQSVKLGKALNAAGIFFQYWESIIEVRSNMLKKINQLITTHIDDCKLSVLQMAEELCSSERKTYRLIKELTNRTPHTYIKYIRLTYARDLIKRGLG